MCFKYKFSIIALCCLKCGMVDVQLSQSSELDIQLIYNSHLPARLKASHSPSLIRFSLVLRLSTFIGCQQAFDSHNSPHGEFIKCQVWKKMFIMRAQRVEEFSYSLISPPIMKNVFRSEFRWPKILKFPHHLLSLAWSLQGSTRSLCYHHYQVQICQQAVRNLMKY